MTTLPTNNYDAMVLLVDDQAMVGEAIRRALANQNGIDFHFCATSDDALKAAERIRPTVILQDLVMPGVDGLTLARMIRAGEAKDDKPSLRLIGISARSRGDEEALCRAAGMDGFLRKPVTGEMLAEVLRHDDPAPIR